jgi:D-ribose pyranase
MLKTGILNPKILSLISRTRHTNTLVIADRDFPFWPQIETVDITLVDDIPTVLQVLDAIKPNFKIGGIYMAQEFTQVNDPAVQAAFTQAIDPIPLVLEPHVEFKTRIPHAVGLIRTADKIPYANMVLVSA